MKNTLKKTISKVKEFKLDIDISIITSDIVQEIIELHNGGIEARMHALENRILEGNYLKYGLSSNASFSSENTNTKKEQKMINEIFCKVREFSFSKKKYFKYITPEMCKIFENINLRGSYENTKPIFFKNKELYLDIHEISNGISILKKVLGLNLNKLHLFSDCNLETFEFTKLNKIGISNLNKFLEGKYSTYMTGPVVGLFDIFDFNSPDFLNTFNELHKKDDGQFLCTFIPEQEYIPKFCNKKKIEKALKKI